MPHLPELVTALALSFGTTRIVQSVIRVALPRSVRQSLLAIRDAKAGEAPSARPGRIDTARAPGQSNHPGRSADSHRPAEPGPRA